MPHCVVCKGYVSKKRHHFRALVGRRKVYSHPECQDKFDSFLDSAMKGKDQCGNPIPKDLVLLPTLAELSAENIDKVFAADWYEANGVLMASAKKIKGLSEDDPADADVDLKTAEILYVAHALKRGNEEDGFYHA